MFAFSFTAALMSLFLISAPLNQNDDKKDEEKLQGTWKCVEVIENGQAQRTEEFKDIRMIIEGNTLTAGQVRVKGDGTEEFINQRTKKFTFKLDSDKNPKQIDLTAMDGPFQGTTVQGIYELRKDGTLIVCTPDKPDGPRPTELKSEEGSGITVGTFTRVK